MSKNIKMLSTEKKNGHTPVKINIQGTQFIITKEGLAKYVSTLHSFSYKRRKLGNQREVYHYSINEAFVFNDSILEVKAHNYSHYCPLGNSTRLDAWYNGKQVANFRSFRGYAGAGSNGTYPFITDGDWYIVFWYDTLAKDEGGNCSIEIYKTVPHEPEVTEAKTHEMKKFLPSDLDLDCEGDCWEDLDGVRQLHWSHRIFSDKTGKYLGRLSLYEYPGFAHFNYQLYGEMSLADLRLRLKMIGKTKRDQFLQILEFDSPSLVEHKIVSEIQISGIEKEELLKWLNCSNDKVVKRP